MNSLFDLTDRVLAELDDLLRRVVRRHWVLLLASLAGVGLLAARILWFRSGAFAFLIWNLILAWIPVVLAHLVFTQRRLGPGGIVPRWLVAAAWLVFFPNAPYLVTDLVHWAPRPPAPFWLDGLLLIHFAWLGLMLGFSSLRMLQNEVARRKGTGAGWAFAAGALGLASFGIYLGRFHRWNSWDVFLSPVELGGEIARRFVQPLEHPRAWGFTLLCAVVLLLAYLMVAETASLSGSLGRLRAGPSGWNNRERTHDEA